MSERLEISVGEIGSLFQEGIQGRVDLRIPFGEPPAQFLRDNHQLEVTSEPVMDLVGVSDQVPAEFMRAGVLGGYTGQEKGTVLQCTPTRLHRIPGAMEHHGTALHLRMERAASAVTREGGHDISGATQSMGETALDQGRHHGRGCTGEPGCLGV